MARATSLKKRYGNRIKDSEDDNAKLYALIRRSETPSQIQVGTLATAGAGSNAGSGSGEFLPTAGGVMMGPIAFFPRLVTIATGVLDITNTTNNYSSRIILTPESGNTDDLVTITGAAFSGQLLFLQGVQTDTITVKTTGNIETIDGNDFTLADDDIIIFMFDTTDNAWQQVTTGKQATVIGGVASGDINLSKTYKITFDDDKDTYIRAHPTTDDILEFYAGGFERFQLDNSELQLQGGVNLDINGNKVILDVDADTYIHSSGDDNIQIFSGGGNRLTITGIKVQVEAGVEFNINNLMSFDTAITKPGGTNRLMIYAENLTNDELVINGLSGGVIRLDLDGDEYMSIDDGSVRFTANGTSPRTNMIFERVDATPNDGDIISSTRFQADNSIGTPLNFATIEARQDDVTSSTEDGSYRITVIDAGALETYFEVQSTDFNFRRLDNQFAVNFIRDEATPVGGRIAEFVFQTLKSTGPLEDFGVIDINATVVTNGSENTWFTFKGMNAGSLDTFLRYQGDLGLNIMEESDGKIGFFNITPVVQQQLDATPTVTEISTLLKAYGLSKL